SNPPFATAPRTRTIGSRSEGRPPLSARRSDVVAICCSVEPRALRSDREARVRGGLEAGLEHAPAPEGRAGEHELPARSGDEAPSATQSDERGAHKRRGPREPAISSGFALAVRAGDLAQTPLEELCR